MHNLCMHLESVCIYLFWIQKLRKKWVVAIRYFVVYTPTRNGFSVKRMKVKELIKKKKYDFLFSIIFDVILIFGGPRLEPEGPEAEGETENMSGEQAGSSRHHLTDDQSSRSNPGLL